MVKRCLFCFTIGSLPDDFFEVKTVGIYTLEKLLVMTHLPVSPMLNTADLMTDLEIQGSLMTHLLL